MSSTVPESPPANLPERRVSCYLELDVLGAAESTLQITPAYGAGLLIDEDFLLDGSPLVDYSEVLDQHNSRIQIMQLPLGEHAIEYRGRVSGPGSDEPLTIVSDSERLLYMRPSRYCPSDRFASFATSEFGHLSSTNERIAAINTWIFERITYELGSSSRHDSAEDTLLLSRGTCRDFAHLGIALSRGLGIPARFAAVYAPGLSPMDFHAVYETFEDGRWLTHDPTTLAPRQSLVRIATGRDAADTAFFSVFPDTITLRALSVSAVIEGDLPLDDHLEPVILA